VELDCDFVSGGKGKQVAGWGVVWWRWGWKIRSAQCMRAMRGRQPLKRSECYVCVCTAARWIEVKARVDIPFRRVYHGEHLVLCRRGRGKRWRHNGQLRQVNEIKMRDEKHSKLEYVHRACMYLGTINEATWIELAQLGGDSSRVKRETRWAGTSSGVDVDDHWIHGVENLRDGPQRRRTQFGLHATPLPRWI
jgi:hypothetical protein